MADKKTIYKGVVKGDETNGVTVPPTTKEMTDGPKPKPKKGK